MNDIKADTSLYTDSRDRMLAAAECLKAQRAGKTVECAARGQDDWTTDCSWDCTSYGGLDYRVKPEPVVTVNYEYDLYVPCLSDVLFDPGNFVGNFGTRSDAMAKASICSGSALIDQVRVTRHDGKVISRERVYS